MQRRTAITTAATVSLVLLAGATAMAVNTGLLRREGTGNVGKLAVVAGQEADAPTTMAPAPADAPPRTIVITVPRPAAPSATAAGTVTVPTTVAAPATTATTVRRPTTTIDDDDDDHSGPTAPTSTTRPRGGDDDD